MEMCDKINWNIEEHHVKKWQRMQQMEWKEDNHQWKIQMYGVQHKFSLTHHFNAIKPK